MIREQHFHLAEDDECYFLWEWNGAPYAESATTNLIGNFQRETRFRRQNAWFYKEQAISHAAAALQHTLPAIWKAESTFVPMPPSKIPSDTRYDTRLADTLARMSPALADTRDLIEQIVNTESRAKNIRPEERLKNLQVKDLLLLDPRPKHLVIFDDVLSGGSHFVAMKKYLTLLFPGVDVSGVFLARRVLPNPNL